MTRPQNQSRSDFELRSLAREIDLLRTEIREGRRPNNQSFLHNPTLLAIIGLLGTVATGIWQLHSARELEREKLRSTLIQEASKSGDNEKTIRTLRFLVEYGLITDENGLIATLKSSNAPSFAKEAPKAFTQREIQNTFGDPKLQFTLEGLGTPDAAWEKENIIDVNLPQMVGVRGFPKTGKIKFHKIASSHLESAIAEIAERGLLSKILSFDGAWAPRNVRGTSQYSIHAYGIAFDINAEFNRLGDKPKEIDAKGSLIELVPIFEKHGFYWGGYFSRPDSMHFQYGIKSE